jgi:hypothetical protein
MQRDFFNPPPEETEIILIDRPTLLRAQRQITSCEVCNPEAEIPFDCVLDYITGHHGSTTEYILERPAVCLRCGGEIREKTLVGWDVDV